MLCYVWLFAFNFLLSFFFNSDIIWTDKVTYFSYTSVEIVPKGSEILIHKLHREKIWHSEAKHLLEPVVDPDF